MSRAVEGAKAGQAIEYGQLVLASDIEQRTAVRGYRGRSIKFGVNRIFTRNYRTEILGRLLENLLILFAGTGGRDIYKRRLACGPIRGWEIRIVTGCQR